MDYKQRFAEIKAMYDQVLPEWMDEYKRTGNMTHDPYIRDWVIEFTPIEYSVWQDIRGNGLPFYPEIPANGYFLDFANPFKRIAIECDGKAFHDKERDAKRDAILSEQGWRIHRITGSECNRMHEVDIWAIHKDEREWQQVKDWFFNTSEGIVFSIGKYYFDSDWMDHEYSGLIDETVRMHRSNHYGSY